MAPSTTPRLSWPKTIAFSSVILLTSWILLHPEYIPSPQSIQRKYHPPQQPPPNPSPLCTPDTPDPPAPDFNLTAVLSVAKSRASHSWEYGVLAEALLELYNPELSVFSLHTFPDRSLPHLTSSSSIQLNDILALAYASPLITTSPSSPTLISGSGSNSDPASLGVSAWLLGQIVDPSYHLAVSRQLDTLLHSTPRFANNGAISHRARSAEVWADSVYMVPPFLAYSAVATHNGSLMREAVRQCELHCEVLRAGGSRAKVDRCKGAWQHFIVGPEGGEFGKEGNAGLWSTSNGWAAAGMVRVLATVKGWTEGMHDAWDDEEVTLVNMVVEILDCVVTAPTDYLSVGRLLLHNHLDDEEWFKEAAGTALIASAAYRLAVLIPELDWTRYTDWADRSRAAVISCVDGKTGVIAPVVKWSDWQERRPWDEASSEAQSFAILMYAAYRDCICAGKCKRRSNFHSSDDEI